MAKDEAMGKPSVESCVKTSVAQMLDMVASGSDGYTTSDLASDVRKWIAESRCQNEAMIGDDHSLYAAV